LTYTPYGFIIGSTMNTPEQSSAEYGTDTPPTQGPEGFAHLPRETNPIQDLLEGSSATEALRPRDRRRWPIVIAATVATAAGVALAISTGSDNTPREHTPAEPAVTQDIPFYDTESSNDLEEFDNTSSPLGMWFDSPFESNDVCENGDRIKGIKSATSDTETWKPYTISINPGDISPSDIGGVVYADPSGFGEVYLDHLGSNGTHLSAVVDQGPEDTCFSAVVSTPNGQLVLVPSNIHRATKHEEQALPNY
jgi:hypothetical protein